MCVHLASLVRLWLVYLYVTCGNAGPCFLASFYWKLENTFKCCKFEWVVIDVVHRYNQRRERSRLKRALSRAEYLSRQEAKNARAKAFEEEEAKKIPYEVSRMSSSDGRIWGSRCELTPLGLRCLLRDGQAFSFTRISPNEGGTFE